jgi:hypothetical protein
VPSEKWEVEEKQNPESRIQSPESRVQRKRKRKGKGKGREHGDARGSSAD